jgi:hypothetical protein
MITAHRSLATSMTVAFGPSIWDQLLEALDVACDGVSGVHPAA